MNSTRNKVVAAAWCLVLPLAVYAQAVGAPSLGGGTSPVGDSPTFTGTVTARDLTTGDITFSTDLVGGADIQCAAAGSATAGQSIDVTGQTGGTAAINGVGQNGGVVTITGGAGSAKNGTGATDGNGGDLVLLGGARGGITGGTEVQGIVRVGSPTVGSTKTTNLLAVGGGLEVDGAAQLDGTLTVTGATTLSSTLDVKDIISNSGAANSGDVYINDRVKIYRHTATSAVPVLVLQNGTADSTTVLSYLDEADLTVMKLGYGNPAGYLTATERDAFITADPAFSINVVSVGASKRVMDVSVNGIANSLTDLFSGNLQLNDNVVITGNTTIGVFTSNGGPLYTNGSGLLAQTTAGTIGQVLHGGTTPAFGAVLIGEGGAKAYSCTLNGASTATCTVTVASGSICTCSDSEPSVVGVAAMACSVSATTATVTSATTLDTSIVKLVCTST